MRVSPLRVRPDSKRSRSTIFVIFNPDSVVPKAEREFLDALVSTDANHTYKPDARAYRLGMDQLHLVKSEIVFAAFGGWDAAGAKSFGYPTFWVNRFNQPLEELGIRPDGTSTNIDGLLDFVLNRTARP